MPKDALGHGSNARGGGNQQALPAEDSGFKKPGSPYPKPETPYQRNADGSLTPLARDQGGNPIFTPTYQKPAPAPAGPPPQSFTNAGVGTHGMAVHNAVPTTFPRGPEVPAGRPPSDINQAAAALRAGNPKAAPPKYAAQVSQRINQAAPMGRKLKQEGETGYYDENEQYHATGASVMTDKDFGGKPGAMNDFASALRGLAAKQSPEDRKKNSGLSDADIRGIKYG